MQEASGLHGRLRFGVFELDFRADGLSALRVISRTSVMACKHTRKPLPQIVRELNVDAWILQAVLV